MVQISLGLGNRLELLESNAARYRELLKARLLHQVWVVVGLALVKVSICLFLLRLVAKKLYIRVLWGIIGFMFTFTIASVLTLVGEPFVFSCNYIARVDTTTMIFTDRHRHTSSCSAFPLQPHGITPYVHRQLDQAMQSATALGSSLRLGSSTEVCMLLNHPSIKHCF